MTTNRLEMCNRHEIIGDHLITAMSFFIDDFLRVQ